MLKRDYVQEVLDTFLKTVISQARRSMTLQSISTTGALYDSFQREVEVHPNSISASILSDEFNEYGKFVDRGVKGVESGHSIRGYSFKSKGGKNGLKGMPPPYAFKLDKLQRPVSDTQAFATAVKIFKQGIKPSLFMTKPFESAFEKLPQDVVEAYGLDLENFMDFVLNDRPI